MKRKARYLLVLLVLVVTLFAGRAATTRSVTSQGMIWTRLTNTLVIDSHWTIFSEADSRIFDRTGHENQVLLRLMGRYAFRSGITIGAGVVGSFGFSNDPLSNSNLMTPEVRACADVAFQHQYGRVLLIHRNVIENRFIHNASTTELQPGYKYVFRYRYRLQANFELWRKADQNLKFMLSDEIMLQLGKSIVYNVFDQNRAYAALNYEPLKWLGFEAGYMHLFQQRSTGSDFYSRHIFRLSIHTKIFVKQKQKVISP